MKEFLSWEKNMESLEKIGFFLYVIVAFLLWTMFILTILQFIYRFITS